LDKRIFMSLKKRAKCNFRSQKRPLTLLEVMIALVLAGFILYYLFDAHSRAEILNVKLERAKERVVLAKNVQQRLMQLFGAIVPPKTENPSLYTSNSIDGTTLFLLYDAGIDPDPQFWGPITAELSLQDLNFSLISTSSIVEKRSEILYRDVKRIAFQFYDKKGQGFAFWDKTKESLPTLIELTLFFADDQLDFAFFPGFGKEEVVYKKAAPTVKAS
jgi:type II secretory pathway pseudopilin PulG